MQTTKNRPALFPISSLALGLALALAGCAPPGTRALLDGDRLVQEGKYAQAIEKLKLATEILPEPHLAKAWTHLGLAYHKAGKNSEAQAAYQEAIRRNRILTAAHLNLGSLQLEQNNPAGALPPLKFYVSRQRHDFTGWLKLGTAHLRLREWDDAEKCFHNARQLNPASAEVLNNLGVIQVQRKRLVDAFNYFAEALQLESQFGPALLNLAVLDHQHLNNRPLALRRYKAYLDLQPVPPHHLAVQELVRQIELELAPRPVVLAATNPPAAAPLPNSPLSVTNQNPTLLASAKPSQGTALDSPPARTTPPAASPEAADTEPRDDPRAANKETPQKKEPSPTEPAAQPVLKPPPAPVEAPQPEPVVVKVQEDFSIKPAQDTPETPPPGAPEAGQSISQSAEPNSLAAAPTAVLPPLSPSRPPEERRPVLDRINPMNWFRNRSGDETVTLPNTAFRPAPRVPSGQNTSPSTGQPASSTSEPLVIPRYTYRSPAPPPAGDRLNAERHFLRALKAQRERRLTEAITSYWEALKADPSYYEAYFNLGLAAYETRDWTQSLSAYESALALRNNSADARYNFALALQMANYPFDAAQELQKLLAQHPKEARAHFSLGKLYAEHLRQRSLAREHYQKVLELDPRHPEAVAIRYWLAAHP